MFLFLLIFFIVQEGGWSFQARRLNTEHIFDGLVSFGPKIFVIFVGVLRLQVGLTFLEFQDFTANSIFDFNSVQAKTHGRHNLCNHNIVPAVIRDI